MELWVHLWRIVRLVVSRGRSKGQLTQASNLVTLDVHVGTFGFVVVEPHIIDFSNRLDDTSAGVCADRYTETVNQLGPNRLHTPVKVG